MCIQGNELFTQKASAISYLPLFGLLCNSGCFSLGFIESLRHNDNIN